MKYLIFGGTGFIGRNLSQYLYEQGEEVFAVSRSGTDNTLAVDITKSEDFEKIDFEPDVIINCASRIPEKEKTSKDPEFLTELFLTNVVGSLNITNWAVKKNIIKLINCSTLVVVKKPWPKPLTEGYVDLPEGFHVGYGMSKLSQEQIMNYAVQGSKTKLVHARLSAVYGEGMVQQGLIFHLLEKLKNNKEILLTDAKKNTLDLIHVRDVCRSIFAISQGEFMDSVINIARGEEVSVMNLAEILKNIAGSCSLIKNEETLNPSSVSRIDIHKLKRNVGEEYHNFLTLEDGLSLVVRDYEKTSTNFSKK